MNLLTSDKRFNDKISDVLFETQFFMTAAINLKLYR